MGACGNLSQIDKYLAVVAHGIEAFQATNLALADASFRVALALAKAASIQQQNLVPLALLQLARLRRKQGREDDARQLREQAISQLEQNEPSPPNLLFQYFMADVLMDLTEYRRAIPFWEQSIQLDDTKDPIDMTRMLSRVGECYSRVGLKDHALIPLRAAIKTLRKHPEDPHLPATLLTLGNVLRKSAPTEAEGCFREAADWEIARGHYLSATPAWGNMAILCSEQGRYDEALDFFQRVRKIREQSSGVPVSGIAITFNNLANCYRRMGKFTEAFEAVARAIELLEGKGGPLLASAYGTRGLVFLDQGKDSEAVEWLRRAYDYRQTLPSPSFESGVDDLKYEIAALQRLGRSDALRDAESRLATMQAAKESIAEVNRDLTALDAPVECAVFVEVIGGRGLKVDPQEYAALERRMSEAMENHHVGRYGGRANTLESRTFFFYGPDAEQLFRILEPMLLGETLCLGARVTIRQQDGQREVILPGPVM